MADSKPDITVYYDGQCPMCNFEIGHLKKADTQNKIQFEDIKAEGFSELNPKLNTETLDAILHVKDANGKWIKGLDANYLMWQTVGRGKWFSPLKWKWLRPISSPIYACFAKYRHTLAALLFRKHQASNKQTSHHHE